MTGTAQVASAGMWIFDDLAAAGEAELISVKFVH